MLKNSETTTEFKLPRNLYFLLAGIVISLIPAMINGYPLVLTDTELYIQAGRELKTLEDRSFIYGWILVYSALKKSFFISIFFQSIIFNSVFFLFLQKQFHENAGKYFIYLILFLSLFTSLAWDVCYLMPDIFSSISLILIYLILVEKNKTRILVFAFMYVVFAQTHFSYLLAHPLILGALMFIKVFFKKFQSQISLKKIIAVLLLTIMNLFLFSGEKIILSENKTPTKVWHIFLMAKLSENGLLQKYLSENCKKNTYEICDWKDSIPVNSKAGDFLWDYNSVFNRTGSWSKPHDEYKMIIIDILTHPMYCSEYFWLIIRDACKGLLNLNFGKDMHAYSQEKMFNRSIGHYYRDNIAYNNSLQMKEKLVPFLDLVSFSYLILFLISTAVVIILFQYEKFLAIFFSLSVFFNSVVTSGLISIEGRYSARQNWLMIVIAVILIRLFIEKRKLIHSDSDFKK